MSTFAIGDIQGCFEELQQLLAHIHFDAGNDTLWFTGDLVNRGPQSLDVLRFVKSLGDRQKTVLGNHDLHLLAVAYGVSHLNDEDTLNAILAAPDRDNLLDWLRHQPLLHHDATLGYVMTHAGLAPSWDLQQARALAHEVETVLRSDSAVIFLKEMRGNEPDHWDDALAGMARLRCITNYLTRLRYCKKDGRLDLTYHGDIEHKPADLIPWFEMMPNAHATLNIIFGHWAALKGQTKKPHLYPIDTGCVWGGCLTALRLEDGKRFFVTC